MAYNEDNQTQTAKKFSFFWKYGGISLLLQNEILNWSLVLYIIVNV